VSAGHFAGMPSRSLHAHGAVAPSYTPGCPRWVALLASRRPPRAVAATARAEWGYAMREGAASMICGGAGWRMACNLPARRIHGRRRAATSPGC
jgi:hypothetical protein